MAAAQQLVLGAGLQLQRRHIGHRHLRRRVGHLAITRALAVLGMEHGVRSRDRLRLDVPFLGGGGDQHRLGARARLAQLIPGARDRGRTAAALIAIDFGIEVRLLDHDMVPVGVQLLGDDQAERGLDALADFRRLGIDGDLVVRRDADKSVDALVLAGFGGGLRHLGGGLRVWHMKADHQPGARRARQFQKAAALQRQRPRFTRSDWRARRANDLAHIGVGFRQMIGIGFGFGCDVSRHERLRVRQVPAPGRHLYKGRLYAFSGTTQRQDWTLRIKRSRRGVSRNAFAGTGV